MKKWSALLTAVMWSSGYTSADKAPYNLKGFTVNDICPTMVFVYIDDKESELDNKRLEKILFDQDALFKTGFMEKSHIFTCTQYSSIIFEATKFNSDSYLYTYKLELSSKDAITRGSLGEIELKFLSFYSIGEIGMVTNLNSLREEMDSGVKKAFQAFILDWRKMH